MLFLADQIIWFLQQRSGSPCLFILFDYWSQVQPLIKERLRKLSVVQWWRTYNTHWQDMTFWLTHHHSPTPNNYSWKHTSFSQDLWRLRRLHKNVVWSYFENKDLVQSGDSLGRPANKREHCLKVSGVPQIWRSHSGTVFLKNKYG